MVVSKSLGKHTIEVRVIGTGQWLKVRWPRPEVARPKKDVIVGCSSSVAIGDMVAAVRGMVGTTKEKVERLMVIGQECRTIREVHGRLMCQR